MKKKHLRQSKVLIWLIYTCLLIFSGCEDREEVEALEKKLGLTVDLPVSLTDFQQIDNVIQTKDGPVKLFQLQHTGSKISIFLSSTDWLQGNMKLTIDDIKNTKLQTLNKDTVKTVKISIREGNPNLILRYQTLRDNEIYYVVSVTAIKKNHSGTVELMVISHLEEMIASQETARLINSFRLLD